MAAVANSEYQVLEFEIGEKEYCVDLDYVDEIVNNEDEITSLPNTDPEVVGVMDLRGRTTTVVDPRIALDLPSGSEPKYVIVFESDGDPVGWLIEDVNQVVSVSENDVDESVSNESINGVFKQEDQFTIWIDPGAINT